VYEDFAIVSVNRCSVLQTVEVRKCHHILDVTPLQGIPNVKLCGCDNVTDIHPFAQAHSVSIEDCSGIQDVSPLRHVHTVLLKEMTLEDISMLGGVISLTLRTVVGV
jgi:hypothetical protein